MHDMVAKVEWDAWKFIKLLSNVGIGLQNLFIRGYAGYFVHFLLCRGPIGPCEAPYVGVKSVFLIDCFVTKCRFARSNLFTRWPSHYILLSTSENKSKAMKNSLPKLGRCESRIDFDKIAKMLLNK